QSYPLLFEIHYSENDKLKEYYLFYNYKFQIYFLGNKRKIKTVGLEYNQAFQLSDDNPKQKIYSFLLTNGFLKEQPFNSKSLTKDIKLNIIKKDSLNSSIYSLYKINT